MIPEIGQGTILKPYQKPHPPIVVTAVAPHSKGVTEAAKRGWTPISANFLLPEWVASHWPRYVEGCKAVGAEADPADWRVAKSHLRRRRRGHRAALRPVARRAVPLLLQAADAQAGRRGRARNLFKLDQNEPDSEITPEQRDEEARDRRHGRTAWSSRSSRSARTTGDFGTLLYACHDWLDPALGRRSMQLMAEQVMPRVNAALASRTP